jgi:hypothetical protein
LQAEDEDDADRFMQLEALVSAADEAKAAWAAVKKGMPASGKKDTPALQNDLAAFAAKLADLVSDIGKVRC